MSFIRENRLRQLVFVLWHELGKHIDTTALERGIREEGLGWALPTDSTVADDAYLTPEELCRLLGYTESGIRNWKQRYNLHTTDDGKYRWGDVRAVLEDRGGPRRRAS
ncbi:hypothetical protein [Mycobacterium aquaticum]|uniref:Helix-turn-helix domain-containing protein n=1 Tax=Mycobacterium aquaticum TaxID=1927124 RepID=A0A1X0A5M2_9MYCO|nr:hypothetical protein [Mycobacterium aquaticum]ORA25185.1 hypothetical protein BST13_33225 [Mycobacterium aquaticum]